MGQLDWNFRLPPGLFGLLMLGNQRGKNYCAGGVIGPAYKREIGSLPHNGEKWGLPMFSPFGLLYHNTP